ncbi:U3 small nucleolar RNA-associated protein 9 [[Candida] railenensis]|uniref:U3 small nucleolar RNA-associated protein 9 n=1 Tax=[Candida] railenensis TaxID=45579 RepID=A0A9P0VVP7_9ASCO|nr:U3 small nucleolar RNA-associated protein 9 [[Candida] railenensis]
MSVSACFEQNGKYFASAISKNGRNEVQIFPIDSNKVVDPSAESFRIELDANEVVKSICWAYIDNSAEPEKKKRKSVEENSEEGVDLNSKSSHLVVALENGEMKVFTPQQETSTSALSPVKSIPGSSKIGSITNSYKNSSVWTLQEHSNNLSEVSILSGKTLKNFKFDEVKTCNFVHSLDIVVATTTKTSQHLVIGSENTLYLVDPSKPKKSLLLKYSSVSNVSSIAQSRTDPGTFAVLRTGNESGNIVALYSVNSPECAKVFSTSSSRISKIKFVGKNLYVFGSEGVEIFGTQSEEPITFVKTNGGAQFQDASEYNGDEILAVWYDRNEPNFHTLSISPGEIVIDLKDVGLEDVDIQEDEELSYYRKKHAIKNISYEELIHTLQKYLSSEENSSAVLELCYSNNKESNIKNTIKALSTNSSQIIKLFEIISQEVSSHPTRTNTLSIWLKWILLANGGYIASQIDQKDNLRTLQKGLSSGMKLMPKLLSLQGRLNLLKSQMELRNKIGGSVDDDSDIEGDVSNVGNDEDEEGSTTIANETGDLTANGEESIVYANGENDDYQDVLIEVDEDEEDDEDED